MHEYVRETETWIVAIILIRLQRCTIHSVITLNLPKYVHGIESGGGEDKAIEVVYYGEKGTSPD
jgi:hypothetical protein